MLEMIIIVQNWDFRALEYEPANDIIARQSQYYSV